MYLAPSSFWTAGEPLNKLDEDGFAEYYKQLKELDLETFPIRYFLNVVYFLCEILTNKKSKNSWPGTESGMLNSSVGAASVLKSEDSKVEKMKRI